MLRIVADKNQPLVDEYFSSFGSIIKLSPEEINNQVLIDFRADVLICRSTIKINEDLLRNTNIKYVGTCTIGYDHVDLNYLKNRGIGFASAPGCNANSVGEYILAALIKISLKYGYDISSKTLGIVGVGNVGKKVAQKAKALGINILFNDPPRQRNEGGNDFCSLTELLQRSDFVTLHVPLIMSGVDKTFGMVGDEFFENIKNGAVFINASRGAVVKEEPVLRALKEGVISEYVIDVYENEPNVSRELVNNAYIATEHISGHSIDGKINGTKMIFNSLKEYFSMNIDIDMEDPNNKYVGNIVIPEGLAGIRAIEYAVDQCYDIMKDSEELKAAPDNFKELRKNYKIRYEFSHYCVEGRDNKILDILYNLGFGRSDCE